MPATAHAILGASSASRWINCPGSVREIGALPEHEQNRTSAYADEGTAAHALGEYALRKELESVRDFLGRKVKGELQSWPVDHEMIDSVDTWLDEVAYHFERLAKADGAAPQVLVEVSVQPVPGREDLFGTADTILIGATEIVVIDFKYGKGIVVETDWNDQMMYYARGALFQSEHRDDIERATLVVVQPRAIHEDGPVRRWNIPVEVLEEYGDILVAAADRTAEPDAPLVPGDWCRFCPVASRCAALRAQAYSVAETDFDDLPAVVEEPAAHVRLPAPDDPEEVGRAMLLVPLLDFWAREVEGYAQRLMERGTPVPGQKLVRKRANRSWNDPDEVERKLRNRRVPVGVIYKQTLRSPAQLEKEPQIGKPWVAKHCHKPEGGLTIAPEHDKRPAEIPAVLTDFDELPPLDSPAEE